LNSKNEFLIIEENRVPVPYGNLGNRFIISKAAIRFKKRGNNDISFKKNTVGSKPL
jgi:hypothetical protein